MYLDVTPPMFIIRRTDAVLEPATKNDVGKLGDISIYLRSINSLTLYYR